MSSIISTECNDDFSVQCSNKEIQNNDDDLSFKIGDNFMNFENNNGN